MARLEFSFEEIDREIDALSQIAKDFISANTLYVLQECRDSLGSIRRRPSRTYEWSIPIERPLLTVPSKGGYERENRGEHTIVAAISFRWDIEPLGDHSSKFIQTRKFGVSGVASTMVRLFEEEFGGKELAMWRMEIADSNAPGCYFHVQVLGHSPESPFPKSLSIPRFPGLVATPPSVTEFVLGEIFQDEWRMAASQDTAPLRLWRPIQTARITAILRWQLQSLEGVVGSPWLALKTAQPPSNLFLPQ